MSEAANSNGYQRTAISFGVAATRAVVQDADCTFPQATGDWASPITHWAIVDNQTYGSGNVLATGALGASKSVYNNDTPKVASGEVNVTFSANEVSNYLALELLDHCFNNAAYAKPATYVALCTAVIADGDTGSTITEPAGGAYARVQVNINGGASPTWDLAAGTTPTEVDNTHAITWTTATASWGTIVAVAICDAATLGNLLVYDNAMVDKAVGDGDTAEIAIGDLDIQLT
jgi:hypothetical protein